MPFRERASRTGLQIAFELAGRFSGSEFERDDHVPGTVARGVLVLSGVVPVEARCDVRRQAHIVPTRISVTAEHVHESFVGMHAIGCGTNRSAQKCRRNRATVSGSILKYADSAVTQKI